MEYSGWSNRETWCVHLWLSSDEESYNRARSICLGGEDYEAADRLADEVSEMWGEKIARVPGLGASLWSDLIGGALRNVEWREVARAFMDEQEGVHARLV